MKRLLKENDGSTNWLLCEIRYYKLCVTKALSRWNTGQQRFICQCKGSADGVKPRLWLNALFLHSDMISDVLIIKNPLMRYQIIKPYSTPAKYQSTILFTLKRLFYQKWKIDLIKIIILKHIIKIILFCVLYFKRYKLYLYLSQLCTNTA